MTARAGARGVVWLGLLAGLLVAACVLPTSVAARTAPRVDHMVVFKSGKAFRHKVKARGLKVKVGHRRCAAGTGTPLAALFRSKPGKIGLKDFGSCSKHAVDGGGLFVRSIHGTRNKGQNGWVYKVGHKAATAGAADPTGPFGHGRLRSGRRVTWFYCYMTDASCQRTLEVKVSVAAETMTVRVRGYDDAGKGKLIQGAAVHVNGVTAATNALGVAQFEVPAGTYRVYATNAGMVRSFSERVAVK